MRRLYFHPERGWGRSAEGAVVRLDCDLRRNPRNEIYVRSPEGGWSAHPSPASLPARQRGWSWTVRREHANGRDYLAFRGAALVDAGLIAGPLQGLELHAPGGKPLANALNAGEEFWLLAPDAKAFADRLRKAGGEIRREATRPAPAFSRLERLVAEAERLLAADERALQAAAGGDLTVITEFEGRGPKLRELVESGRQAVREMIAELERVEKAGSGDVAGAVRAGEQAAAKLDGLERALVARGRAEAQMQAISSGHERPDAVERDIALSIILRELQRLWEAEGLDVTVDGDALAVDLPEGKLRIGRRPQIEPQGD